MMKHVRIFVGAFVVGLAIMGAWGFLMNMGQSEDGWQHCLL